MNRNQGIWEIRRLIAPFKVPMGNWYVGITNDPIRRVFTEHQVPIDYEAHKCIEADSADIAREIEAFFIKQMKTNGGQGGGDEDARFVYAFLKTKETDPPLK